MKAPAPSLLRARMSSATSAQLRIRMRHPMESGQRRDELGRFIPARHITDFVLQLNEQPLLSGQFGPGISQDPYLELTLKGVKAGDRLQLEWTDNTGARRMDRAPIDPA